MLRAATLGLVLAATADDRTGPQVGFVYPTGVQAGSEATLSVGGDFSSWPVQVWSDDPGISITAEAAPGHFRALVATNASPGPHLIRFHDETGATAPRQFVVGDTPEFTAVEPPATNVTVQVPPSVCHGRFQSAGEIATWHFELPAGATFNLEAAASRLDSPGTLQLRLLTMDATVLGESTNTPPTDPEFRCLVTRAGTYLVEVRPAPPDDAPSPSRDEPLIYRLRAWTTGGADAAVAVAPGAFLEGAPLPDLSSRLTVREAPASLPDPVLHPEMLTPTESLPGTFAGFINPAGDEDRFGFLARRDEIHRFRIRRANPDSLLMPVVRVLQDERVLAESGTDGALTWLAGVDGAYTVAVADANAAGGPDFAYELELVAPEARLVASTDRHTWVLPPGGKLRIPVQIQRPEAHRGVLIVTASGLPPGVIAGAGLVAPDSNTATLELEASRGAPTTSQPFWIAVLDPALHPPRAFPVQAPLRGRHAPAGGLLVNETDTLWLTVRAP